MAQTESTAALLTQYVSGDADAFRALTQRYFPLVFAAALRRCGGQHAPAEDATQQVFIDLARRAAELRADERLGGWLHQRAVRAAGDLMKSEQRRRRREAEAVTRQSASPREPLWPDIALYLDETIQRLSARDRDAILLRCVEGRDFRAVGAALRISEDAAQKRVARALEKLRTMLFRRGLAPSVALLTSGLRADQARAAALSDVASRMAAQAAFIAGPVTAVAPWLLHLKAAAAGTAVACTAWAWPLATAMRNSAAASANVATEPAGNVSALHVVGKKLSFPAPPRLEEGLSVDDIVQRIAALAAMPDSASAHERFRFFAEQLGQTSKGEALQKMSASFRPALMASVDRRHWRHYLLQGWGRAAPLAALDYAWANLPADSKSPAFEGLFDAIGLIIFPIESGIAAETAARWISSRIEEMAAVRHGRKWERLYGLAGDRLARLALDAKSPAILEITATLVNDHRLNFLDRAADRAADEEELELLASISSRLEAPVRRAALMESVLQRLGEFNYPGARTLVEQTESPDLRLIYARHIAAPPHVTRGMQSKPEPQNRYKERADWWLSVAAPEQQATLANEIGEAWLPIDPPWALDWLAVNLPPHGYKAWLEKRIQPMAQTLAARGGEVEISAPLPLLLERLRRADPQGTPAFLQRVKEENKVWPHADKLNSLLTP